MNWTDIGEGFRTVYMLLSGALNVYLFFKARTDQRFQDIEERLESIELSAEEDREYVRAQVAERKAHVADLSERIALIDERLKQLPTHEDLQGINNKLSAVEERSRILLDGMRRIESHLLDH